MTRGLNAIRVYVPARRLARAAIATAHQWVRPASSREPAGTLAVSNWDEDPITMAHAASRLLPAAGTNIALNFCSTTAPFADRSPAALINAALDGAPDRPVLNHHGSQRAASSALLQQLRTDTEGLVVAAERRLAKPASPEEANYGDAAVALSVSDQAQLAEFVGGGSVSVDFVDHYRSSDSEFDYGFEARWVRDEGYMAQVPGKLSAELTKLKIDPDTVAQFCLNAPLRVRQKVSRATGMTNANTESAIDGAIGDTGCAGPLLALAEALDRAAEGDLVVSATFGQGVDVLVFRKTGSDDSGLSAALANGIADDNYLRFLSHRGQLALDWGKRAERDVRTAQSAYFREHDQISGFVGGRCPACGTVQFPRTQACVNPECRSFGEQTPYPLAAETGRLKSFTEDWQAYSPEPPLTYGNVEFDGGANVLMQFCDTPPGTLKVGDPIRCQFRIKDIDYNRNFRRYFWKASVAGTK